jgi:hypothetical protein
MDSAGSRPQRVIYVLNGRGAMKLLSIFSICFVFTAAGGTAQAQGVLFESRHTQNGQATTNQVQMDGQQKTDEVCTVDPKEFGLTPADFEPVRQLAEFMKTLVPAAGSQLFFNGTAVDQGFTGIPVRHISYQNGTATSTTEVTDVRHMTFPASTFEVPAGFRKEAFAGGRR